MLHALSNYFYDRRNGFVKVASYAGSVYLASQYVAERLGDVREKVTQDRQAREKYVLVFRGKVYLRVQSY